MFISKRDKSNFRAELDDLYLQKRDLRSKNMLLEDKVRELKKCQSTKIGSTWFTNKALIHLLLEFLKIELSEIPEELPSVMLTQKIVKEVSYD
jgi:hypothetical protein